MADFRSLIGPLIRLGFGQVPPIEPSGLDRSAFCTLRGRLQSFVPVSHATLDFLLCREYPLPGEWTGRDRASPFSGAIAAGVSPRAVTIICSDNQPPPSSQDKRVVCVSTAELEAHMGDTWTTASMASFLTSRLPPRILCPYQSERPIVPEMFFGRGHVLDDLAFGSDNCVIVGPKRIGKTCLALQTIRLLQDNPEYRHRILGDTRDAYTCVHLDMDTLAPVPLNELWRSLLVQMGLEERDLRPGSRYRAALTRDHSEGEHRTVEPRHWFDVLRRLLVTKYRKAVVILDEVDNAVERDRREGYPVFRTLRSLIEDPGARIRLHLLGYEKLLRAFDSQEFPLNRQRMTPLPLTHLDVEETKELVCGPMNAIGVTIEDPDEIARRVHNATGGLPHLVQDLCRTILGRADVQADRQVNVERLRGSLEHDAFLAKVGMLFDQVRDPLARLVGFLAAMQVDEDKEVTARALLETVHTLGLERVTDADIQDATRQLALYGVFVPTHVALAATDETCGFSNAMIQKHIARKLSNLGRNAALGPLLLQVGAPHAADYQGSQGARRV